MERQGSSQIEGPQGAGWAWAGDDGDSSHLLSVLACATPRANVLTHIISCPHNDSKW